MVISKLKSYISKNFYLPKETFLDLESEFLTTDIKVKHFIYCILHNGIAKARKERDELGELWVPIPSTLIEKHFGRGFNVLDLESTGFIEIKKLEHSDNTYSRVNHICRSYRLPRRVYSVFTKSLERNKDSKEWVNVFSSRPKRTSKAERDLTEVSSLQHSNIVRRATNYIKRTMYNHVQVRKLLQKMKSESYHSEKAKRRYMIDLYAMCIVKSKSERVSDTLSVYTGPSYKVQKSGRLTEQGGFQACTREMKHAAFAGIADIHNYDLKASQVLGLLQLFEEAGISTEELQKVLYTDKEEAARYIGVDVDTYKAALMSLIMGALLVSPNSEKLERSGAIYEYISNGTYLEGKESYIRFYQVFLPLKKDLNKWHTHLIEDAKLKINKMKTIGNKCKIRLKLKEFLDDEGNFKNSAKLRRTLAAFHLQGQEANFIHWLTVLSKQYGFEVMSNQHDGLVTLGAIPDAAIEEAISLSGFRYAKLEEKNFIAGKDLRKPITEAEVDFVEDIYIKEPEHTTSISTIQIRYGKMGIRDKAPPISYGLDDLLSEFDLSG